MPKDIIGGKEWIRSGKEPIIIKKTEVKKTKLSKAEKEIREVLKKHNTSGILFNEKKGSYTLFKNPLHKLAVLDHAKNELEFEKQLRNVIVDGWIDQINLHCAKKAKKKFDYMG